MMEKLRVAAVVGPTAVGKTRLAVSLALRCGGEVVSADSMQVYRGLSIGTAQPSQEEMRGVPHHLIGFLNPEEPFSVADYVKLASGKIRDISARGKLPIVTGGTGLYVRSLLSGVSFSPEEGSSRLRAELRQKAEQEGPQALWDELCSFDPESAAHIHPNNIGRVVRAIEVYRLSGVTMSERQKHSRDNPPPYDTAVIGLAFRDRARLYEAIDRRVDRMVSDGLPAEAERVYHMEHAETASQAIGYKEFFPYFRGECPLADAVEAVKRNSRRYAKRQLTWFLRDRQIHWLFVDECTESELFRQACGVLAEKGWDL